MVRALVARLPQDSLRFNAPVRRVGLTPPRVETLAGESLAARAVIVAAPAYVTADLLREEHRELAHLCDDVRYASTATIALAFPRSAVAHPLNGSGFVVPRVEGTGILAASWLSSKWPHRAPDDRVLMRAFVGGARDEAALDNSDAELETAALLALRPLLGITGAPLLSRVYRCERASAQHEVGHLARMEAIDRILGGTPGLFMTGSGLRGVGIPDCVADARATARKASEWLRHSTLTAALAACADPGHGLGRLPAGRAARPDSPAVPADVAKLLEPIKAADKGQLSVSEEDGRFLRVLIAASNAKRALEIGGAHGYSAIWIGLGLRETGGRLTTIEYDAARAAKAAANVRRAGLADIVTVVPGDAFKEIPKLTGTFDFVFLDAWKRDYKRFFDLVFPRLTPRGLFLAHNVVNKQGEMRDFLGTIESHPGLATSIVRPGTEGMSVSVKTR